MSTPITENDLPSLPPRCAHWHQDSMRTDPNGERFWPRQRHDMLAPRAIVQRLIDDIGSLAPDETSPPVTGAQLQALGWRLHQLQAHSATAVAWLTKHRSHILAMAEDHARDLGNEVA